MKAHHGSIVVWLCATLFVGAAVGADAVDKRGSLLVSSSISLTLSPSQATGCPLACNKTSAFCVNDTDAEPHCLCIYDRVPPAGVNYTDATYCVDKGAVAASAQANAPAQVHTLVCASYSSTVWKAVASILRIIGGCWVALWCVVVLLVFIVFRRGTMCKLHRLIHMQEEIVFALAWLLIAVPFEYVLDTKSIVCVLVSFFENFLYLAALVFLFLEALTCYSTATFISAGGKLCKSMVYMLIGYGIALLVAIISLALTLAFGEYGCHCFCELSGPQVWCFFALHICMAFLIGTTAEATHYERYPVTSDAKHYVMEFMFARFGRTGILLIMPCSLAAYYIALFAVDLAIGALWIVFAVLSLLLGPLIFVYHTVADEVVGTWISDKFPWMPVYKVWARPLPTLTTGALVKEPEPEPEAEPPPPSPQPESSRLEESSSDDDGLFRNFYQWVTDGNDGDLVKESEDVLFTKGKAG